MKFRLASLISAILVMAVLAGCATPRHEFNPEADFNAFREFTFRMPEYEGEKVSDPILDSPLLGNRVRNAVTTELTRRGYSINDENPDFIVTYHAAKDFDVDNSGPRFNVGFHRGWNNIHTGILFDTWPRVSKEGVLIIDIIDAETGTLAWRGWRELPLNQRNFDSEQVNRSTASILSVFPPEQDERR